MADAIPPIKVQIVADTSGLKTGVDQATKGIKDLESNVKTASTGMSSFVSKLKQVGATIGVAFAGQQVVQFGKDIIMAASDMNETMSKTAVIFGTSFDKINKFAETSATTMGMSKQAALDASSTFALFGQSAGLSGDKVADFSGQMVKLSADFASFYNTSPQDAITAIGAAFRGENEPIRRYNILLDDASERNEALRLGLIKTTKDALTPQQRVLAAQSLILKQSTVAQGDFERTASGTANTMRILSAQFANAKVALGNVLLPTFQALLLIMKPIIAALAAFGSFLAKNSDSVKVFVVTVTALSAAWGIYTLAVNASAIAQKALNLVMAINPMVAVIATVGLLAVGLYKLYQNSETFRKIVIVVAKAAILAFAAIIPMVGQVFEAIMKINTGPLRLLLMALSHLPVVGKYAKSGLELMNKGLDGISNFADSASKKAKELAASLDATGKAADKAAAKTKAAVKDTDPTKKPGGLDPKTQEKLKGYIDKAVGLQKDMQDVIDEANSKALDALNTRNEKMAEANQNYLEKEADLRKNYAEAMADAQKTYDERVLDINKTYDAKELDLLKTNNAKIADLQAKAEEKRTDLIKSAAEKRQSIVQQSMDRLRDAFASKTGFDIADAFGAGATTGKSLLEKLRGQLKGAKDLQASAGKLAAAGYSQTFIEQIVKQGPEVGNQIAQALADSTPEETKALQDSFAEMEKVQNSGLDSLAASMNAGANLATAELKKAYDQVAIDLKDALTTVDDELKKGMAEANANYQEAMAQTKADRDSALADALATFTEAKAKAQKTLDEGLADAQKTLTDALLKAQKEYENAIDDINKATVKKLEDLKTKLAEVMALIAAISSAQAAAVAAKTPVYTPIVASPLPGTSAVGGTNATTNITTNVTGVNLTSPGAVADAVTAGIKYGSAITVNTTTLAGIMAASGKSNTTSTSQAINTATGVSNKIKAAGLNIL